jgi:hypothetical protein
MKLLFVPIRNRGTRASWLARGAGSLRNGRERDPANTRHTIEPVPSGPIDEFGCKTVVDHPPFEGSNGSLAPGASAR